MVDPPVDVFLNDDHPGKDVSLVVGAARSMCAVAECTLSSLPALSAEKYLITWPSLPSTGFEAGL